MAWKQAPRHETSQTARTSARRLRRSMTDAEKVLWKLLRDGVVGPGTHFRRQVPIGSFVADFCCLKHRLIVELDGPIHDRHGVAARDRVRDGYLADQGFRVLRFGNEDVKLRRDEVLDSVRRSLRAATPTPGPSPQGGGEPRGGVL